MSGYKELITLNGKEVSFEMVYNIIGRRFHQCLKTASEKEDPQRIARLEDQELVHQICRHERLTFFNFLRLHIQKDGDIDMNEETIKEMLNREY